MTPWVFQDGEWIDVTPAPGSTIGTSPVLRAGCGDDVGVDRVEWSFRTSEGDPWQIVAIDDNPRLGGEEMDDPRQVESAVTWDNAALAEGSYQVRIVAHDFAGNASEPVIISYFYNASPAAVQGLAAVVGFHSVTLTWPKRKQT